MKSDVKTGITGNESESTIMVDSQETTVNTVGVNSKKSDVNDSDGCLTNCEVLEKPHDDKPTSKLSKLIKPEKLDNKQYGVKGVSHLYDEFERKGDVYVEPFSVRPDNEYFINFRNTLDKWSPYYIDNGDYVRLIVNHQCMMSDTGFERLTNKSVIEYSNGQVLIGGLGIGMIVYNLLEKDNIKSITVIENNQDVIDLVSTKFHDERLKIIKDDIWTWKPTENQKYDTIYFDIWEKDYMEIISDVNKLYKRFTKYINFDNKDYYINGWMYDSLLDRRKRRCKYLSFFPTWKGFLTDPINYDGKWS